MEFLQSQVENDILEDMDLQHELRHALDVINDVHENDEMPSQCNVKSIVAYVKVGEKIEFPKVHLLIH